MFKVNLKPGKPLKNSLVKNLSLKSAVLPMRSMEGFETFMNKDYIKKRGQGRFASALSYVGNLKMFLSHTNILEERWHAMTKAELMQAIVRFNDLQVRYLQPNSANNLNSTLSAYMDYVRHTLGHYNAATIKMAA